MVIEQKGSCDAADTRGPVQLRALDGRLAARDPFGDATRAALDPVESVHRLSDLGAYGVTFHDDDLIPSASPDVERDRLVARFRAALDETGLVA